MVFTLRNNTGVWAEVTTVILVFVDMVVARSGPLLFRYYVDGGVGGSATPSKSENLCFR